MNAPCVGFVLEQTLGHVSHTRNLQRSLAGYDAIGAVFRQIPFEPAGAMDRLPPRSNWTVRSGVAARRAVADLTHDTPLDALFVHTFVPAVLLGPVMDRIPTVVSIDATPVQLDALGASYNHRVRSGRLESWKRWAHQRAFDRAASFVTWSQWAADSLIADYGIEPTRIDVLPPGVVQAQWRRAAPRPPTTDVVKVLFVGGDFERKGGPVLLGALEALQNDRGLRGSGKRVEFHVVTAAPLPERPGLRVHNGLTSNSPALIALYHECDAFLLPTRGDCSPMVLAEAASAGLPVVATDIGAIRETVLDGVTGFLVEPEAETVTAALRALVLDDDLRARFGAAAVVHAARTMDAEVNARAIADRLVGHARPQGSSGAVALTVSGVVDEDISAQIEAGERPLADYVAIAKATGASIIDRRDLHDDASRTTAVLRRLAGDDVALAHHLFVRRSEFDVVVTDGEQVGLPLAALLRFTPNRRVRHVMITHRISPRKKALLVRLLGLARAVDEVLTYSESQREVARRLFTRPTNRVRRIDFMVDTEFFRHDDARCPALRPLICTAGREFRDYPTLIDAVRDMEADVVIASASPWSKRADRAECADLPANVQVTSLSQRELRDLFDGADLVVVPLVPNDFQAGVTTILEAMAMGLPVVCTATDGQTDVVVDGVHGRYVPAGDVAALREVIAGVLDDRPERVAMGRRGRELVVDRADVRTYADVVADLVSWHLPRV